MIKISRRLAAVADCVPPGAALADIGSDHALIPCFLAEQGRIRFAVAGEINEGPYFAARKQVIQAGLQKQISVRRGDGLAVIAAGEVDTIVIAGMGGGTITNILAGGKPGLAQVRRLILQPNVGEKPVREWLIDNGWLLTEEYIVAEDGKIYEIIVADRHDEARQLNDALIERTIQLAGGMSRELALDMGPHLLAHPAETFFAKWAGEIAKREKVIASLRRSAHAQSQQKLTALSEQLEQIREVLRCLHTVKP